jgi:hypothetical protein
MTWKALGPLLLGALAAVERPVGQAGWSSSEHACRDCLNPFARRVIPYLRLNISPSSSAVSMQAPLGERSRGGDTRREERSGFARLLFALGLHQRRIAGAVPRVVHGFQRGFSSKSQRIGEGLLATECDCRIKLTAPSSASQIPAAYPPAIAFGNQGAGSYSLLTAELPERLSRTSVFATFTPFFD